MIRLYYCAQYGQGRISCQAFCESSQTAFAPHPLLLEGFMQGCPATGANRHCVSRRNSFCLLIGFAPKVTSYCSFGFAAGCEATAPPRRELGSSLGLRPWVRASPFGLDQ